MVGLFGGNAANAASSGILKFRADDNVATTGRAIASPEQNENRNDGLLEHGDQTMWQKGDGSGQKPGLNQVKTEKDGNTTENYLMGKAKPPLGLEKLETADLSFAASSKDSLEEEMVNEDAGAGLYDDLVNSIREIYQILAANDGNKQDFFGMVSELKSQFGPLGSSPCMARVNTYIRESAPFSISNEEFENLWD
ncbi:hypothetical protein DBR40_07120 [Pedobacter sp. KBW01]|nr:hypothetical protein DBR40_07120 [Pedobacter sp. KBW01]